MVVQITICRSAKDIIEGDMAKARHCWVQGGAFYVKGIFSLGNPVTVVTTWSEKWYDSLRKCGNVMIVFSRDEKVNKQQWQTLSKKQNPGPSASLVAGP